MSNAKVNLSDGETLRNFLIDIDCLPALPLRGNL